MHAELDRSDLAVIGKCYENIKGCALGENRHDAAKIYINNAADNEKKDNRVDSAMAAEASFVSLFNWEERMYSAGEVGNAK